jgi:nucleoside-diphosphate-sugar epimerase
MGALTLVVTGAAGFLGRHIVEEARTRGHQVRAVVRGAGWPPWEADQGIKVYRLDLVAAADLALLLTGADAVIHAAAALTGAEDMMRRDTIEATQLLLNTPGLPRLVLASSLSVYAAGLPGGTIDESSPIESRPEQRDAYTRSKLAQEEVVRQVRRSETWMLRIGALFGPGRLWNAHLGVLAGSTLIRIGAGRLPVTWVRHAALACVLAAETPTDDVSIINVVDDDLPHAKTYLRALGPQAPRFALPVSWRVLDAVTWVAGGSASLPGLLRRSTLRARAMPRSWPNRRLHEQLGWSPYLSFEAAMACSREGTS